jgi:NAD(P)H-dependent FMN reductase
MMAAPQMPNAFPDFKNVLILVGLPPGPVSRALSRHALDSSPDGVFVNVFDDLARLPLYSEALEADEPPDAVAELRIAATEADAVLVVTSYYGRVPAAAHNAIDWLTRRWRHGELHDKPLAVIGRSSGCYSGVWSHQETDTLGGLGPRVIEPLTVPTLREAVKKLACEVHGGSVATAIWP